MIKSLFFTFLILLSGCFKVDETGAKKVVVVADKKINIAFKINLVEVIDTELSNGSTDSEHDVTHIYHYSPTEEESEHILNQLKINNKSSLRDYLTAIKNSDQDFLNKINEKPNVDRVESVDALSPKGGKNSNTEIIIKGDDWTVSESESIFFSNTSVDKLVRMKGQRSTINGAFPSVP